MKILLLGFFMSSLLLFVPSIFAQTQEQNEKSMLCWDWKEKIINTNPDAFLVNCVEFANEDYDTIEEYLKAEHPELLERLNIK